MKDVPKYRDVIIELANLIWLLTRTWKG